MRIRFGSHVPLSAPTVALAMVVVCALALAGCGTSTTTGTTGAAPTATTAPAPTATTAPTPTNTVPAATNTPGGAQAAISITSGSSGFAFSPGSMTIKAGTTVTWTNKTGAPHTVTSDSGDPASFDGSVGGGATFSFTFTTPGTYQYHCSIHPYMAATITVTM